MEKLELDKENVHIKWQLSEFRYDDKSRIFFLPTKESLIDYSDGARIENYILNSIKKCKDISESSEELMQYVKDWPSYYHLGVGRSNIFKSLHISRDVVVLELGAGCGALTRYLGENFKSVDSVEGSYFRAIVARERCRDLNNVKVFSSNFRNIKFSNSYDIVTLIGVLEYAPIYFGTQCQDPKESALSLLRLVKTALKKGGVLILAIENKIGLKYWSGCAEDHTGKKFDSIHGYPTDQTPVTFSKKELENLLELAGFTNILFFYCFPDYKFASTVISDIGEERDFYLHNWIDIPFQSYTVPRTYAFHEGLVVKTLSEAGLLREFANSFLVVASEGNSGVISKPDWVAKKFSVKRRKMFRCVTTLKLKPEIHIEKKRLVDSNDVELNFTTDTIKIKHKVTDDVWYEGDLMIFDVFALFSATSFKSKVLHLLREYYRELIDRYYIGINDKENYPLLRGDAIDFIFRNIIKNKDELRCIDREWHMRDSIPADYVLYRCIVYDVIQVQIPWIKSKVRDIDMFTIQLIREFFPQYTKCRHNKNKRREELLQDFIVGDFNQSILIRKFAFLRNRIIRNIVKKMRRTLTK